MRENRDTRAVRNKPPLRTDRLRTIAGQSFAFIPHRFLRDGFFASLAPDQLRLYLFLVLAADRDGISFYHYDSICSLLECTLEDYVAARNALIHKDLIAFDGSRSQVLSLPDRPTFDSQAPIHTDQDMLDRDPATIRHHLRDKFR